LFFEQHPNNHTPPLWALARNSLGVKHLLYSVMKL
jgi:hypothetical protein